MKTVFFSTLIVLLGVYTLQAQDKAIVNSPIDSLETVLNQTRNTRQKMKLWLELAKAAKGVEYEKMHFYADKIIRFAQKRKVDTLLVKGYQFKGEALPALGEPDSAVAILRQALAISRKINHQRQIADTYNILAVVIARQGKLSEARNYFLQALQIFRKLDNQVYIAKLNHNIGATYSIQGKYRKALKFYEESLKINEKISGPDLDRKDLDLCSSYINLGIIYSHLNDYDRSFHFYQKGIVAAEKEGNKEGLSSVYNQLGLIYQARHNHHQALDMFQQSLQIALEMKDQKNIASKYSNLATLYLERKEYAKATDYYQKAAAIYKKIKIADGWSITLANQAKILVEQKKYQKALKYLQQALNISQKSNLTHIICQQYQDLSMVFLALKQYDKAYQYAKKVLALSEEAKDHNLTQQSHLTLAKVYEYRQEANKAIQSGEQAFQLAQKTEVGQVSQLKSTAEFLAKVYEKQQNHTKALHYYKIFKNLSDSLLNETEIKKFTTLENEYQYEQEKAIAKAQQEQTEAKLAQGIQQQTYLRNIFVIISLFLLLLVFLIFIIYCNKNKAHKALQKKNKVIHQQAEELQSTNKILAKLNRFKEDMTNMLVHDLKNPLNAIISLTGDLYKPQHQQTVHQSGQNMLNIVNNMLGVQKLKETNITLKKIQVDLSMLLHYSYHQVSYLLQQKQIQFELVVPQHQQITLDKELAQRVLINLLENAIKYTPNNGKISLRAEVTAAHGIKVLIQDNGKGIATEDLETIFHKYQQVNPQQLGVTPSTGLGLNFCKLAIEAQGGEIGAISTPGQGSTFWFTLPLSVEDSIISQTDAVQSQHYSVRNDFDLNPEEKQYLQPFIEEIKQFEVFEISEIKPILQSIPSSNQENIQKWKKDLEASMYNSNEARFVELLTIIA